MPEEPATPAPLQPVPRPTCSRSPTLLCGALDLSARSPSSDPDFRCISICHAPMLQRSEMPLILSEWGGGPDESPLKGTVMNGSAQRMSPKLPPLETSTVNGNRITPGQLSHSPEDDRINTSIGLASPPSAIHSAPVHSLSKSADSSLPSPDGSNAQKRHPPSASRYSHPPISSNQNVQNLDSPQTRTAPRLLHRHTLEVPRPLPRASTELAPPSSAASDDSQLVNGRFSPTTRRRRASITLGKKLTRSNYSDGHLEEPPMDEDAARWTENIKQKRISRRRRKDDEDDERVVVGTKVDQHHVNWVTAYNMLTGIRFTVSRTNAKLDRSLTDEDFQARHKFSFDITGNELTPSAKYDFKFKDYAPWVFRHLRAIFRIDPADYLISLTSKYILSELGSPGKSGSFFYFSRDYKYIIKTIHHAEHRFLRKILRQYYDHVQANPDTLLSQFYGLHRVKIPYGRKIHFVVMNNLFPPHRDIHRTFDLKGSTMGRDYKEDDIEKHPRATLKDLNWLRRNQHLEFGPYKKGAFLEQMKRDVELLARLKIMDYSLLVGIHDLERGNEDDLRNKTLRVFQPGGDEEGDDPAFIQPLARTPSKLETARKAKELRQNLKNQRPQPMGRTTSKMPEEMPGDMVEDRKKFYFYSDDGGFRATHQDDRPGEEIYYLGIIDCLTRYSMIKRGEHFIKSLTNNENEISAVPPDKYGARFVKFISGITVPREIGGEEKKSNDDSPDRVRSTMDGPDGNATLPVVEEKEAEEKEEKEKDDEAISQATETHSDNRAKSSD